ncbi:MAG: hypothetical protein AAGG68_00090 [Bacteroidota bacterium]
MKSQESSNRNVKISFILLFLIAISIIMIVQPYQELEPFEEIVEESSQEAKPQEIPKRAELYVLRAVMSRNYPCYHCPDSDSIFLSANEVWKYGVLKEEEDALYTDKYLQTHFLAYFIQFEGTVEECLEQEKSKISNYALLSENLKRETPLLKPPGNR